MKSLLYPIESTTRTAKKLDGMWDFIFDPQGDGKEQGYHQGFQADYQIPVPSSFNDYFLEAEQRNYTGDFWYQTEIFIHATEDDVILRFGAATHEAVVYVNGQEVAKHRGGFLPFECNITKNVKFNQMNKVVVQLNNELSHTTLPAGETKIKPDGTKEAQPYFDFYNYAGLIRPVWLITRPKTAVMDFDTKITLEANEAKVRYQIYTNTEKEELNYQVELWDEGELVASTNTKSGVLVVKNPKLWQVRDAYLYKLKIKLLTTTDELVDEYTSKIGLRTVKIEGERILLNGKPIYLKGYGKHEDSYIRGRGYDLPTIKYDFELMKWTNANAFRTSHYPYDEEVYQLADEEGFLIIDEVPAVGFMQSTMNFLAAGTGQKVTPFFDNPDIDELYEHHLSDIKDMIQRDKNHPSVIAWSLMNEPDTSTESSKAYFAKLFAACAKFDPQQRPRTFTLILLDTPKVSKCYQFADFICLNRYYGWYFDNGNDFDQAMVDLDAELAEWQALELNKPFIFTEFGADALQGASSLPAQMWSEDYQIKCVEMYQSFFDKYSMIQGELIWNFADFETSESTSRVLGNKKGVFTRTRQPKRLAYQLKDRWENK